ncbi:hypothetical protein KAR91_87405 [Candidatus Pacearchaeota archaeon]|nr:hypothetical protein [Candidatus Pacearchaeota archaeon]
MVKVPRKSDIRVKKTAPGQPQLSKDVSLEAFGGGTSAERVASAARGAAESISGLAIQQRARADKIKVKDETGNLSAWENDYLNNPKTGVLNRKGENSFTIPDEFEEAFNGQVKEMEGRLTNEGQRVAFNDISTNYRNSMLEKINKHVSNETETYENNKTNALIENESLNAINAFDDPKRIDESIERQRITIREYGSDNGLPKEQVELMTFNALSKTHIGVVDNLISTDSDEAKRYYKENKSEINQADMTEADLDKKINTVQKANVQNLVDDFEEKLNNDELTPPFIDSMRVPVSEGGVGDKVANTYLRKLQATQKAELNEIANFKTVQHKEDKEYSNLVDKLIDDDTDNFTMKQVLTDAYIDGSLTKAEKQKLNKIRTLLKDVDLNKNPTWNPFKAIFRDSKKQINALLDRSKFEDKNITDALRRLIDYDINMDKDDKEMEFATNEIIKEEQRKVNPPDWAQYKKDDIIDTQRGPGKVIGFYPDGEPNVELLN